MSATLSMDLRERISRLERELASIKSALNDAVEEADRQIAEVHRSYRRDIVLRQHLNPDITRRDLS